MSPAAADDFFRRLESPDLGQDGPVRVYSRRSFPFSLLFPSPIRLKGRRTELATLVAAVTTGRVSRLALVGGGGSGKSVHRRGAGSSRSAGASGRRRPGARGGWDHRTLWNGRAAAGRRAIPWSKVRAASGARPDAARPRQPRERQRDGALPRRAGGRPVTWLLTARRCLLSGVSIFPAIAPLVSARRNAFPAVAALTSPLRWNPLALDIADALVAAGACTVEELGRWLPPGDLAGAGHGPRGRRGRGPAGGGVGLARLPPRGPADADRARHCRATTWTCASIATLAEAGRAGAAALARLRRGG